MFSDKLTCAIRLMNILSESSLWNRTNKPGLNSTQLLKMLDVETLLYRSVKRQLLKEGLLCMKGERVVLGKDAAKVSLMRLMLIFHAGLPLGSSTRSDLNRRDYLLDSRYKPLRELENRLELILAEQLEKVFVLEVCDSPWHDYETEK